MRLLILTTEFPPGPGGIGTHAHQLALNLQKLGWETAVATSQDYSLEDDVAEFNRSQSLKIISFRTVKNSAAEALHRWSTTSRFIKLWKPDIVIASGARAVWLAAALTWRHRIPWIAIGHGTEFGKTIAWERKLMRVSFQSADAVICVSQFTSQQMHTAGIRPRANWVIPNGADAERFRVVSAHELKDFRDELGLPDAKLLVTVGQVTERKGQDVVIRAMPQVLKQVPNTHYLIAGMPTKREQYLRLARELGVERNVHFLGRVGTDRLPYLLNCSDIFVMTSRYTKDGDFEGFGIAVVEAALCGKPAVVSGNSGLAEAVVDGETGIVVPQENEIATAEALLSLLISDEKRLRMGCAALRRAKEEQTWGNRVKEYDVALREVLDTRVRSTFYNSRVKGHL